MYSGCLLPNGDAIMMIVAAQKEWMYVETMSLASAGVCERVSVVSVKKREIPVQ
jgi:hypothetical protein